MIIPNVVNSNNNNYAENKVNSNDHSFSDIFNEEIDKQKIQFSKHASMRLINRNIALSGEQIKRIESGVEIADKKGINDSLVLVDDVALVVNIKNKVVITALDKNSRNNVFTNIDGAVIV